MPKKPISDIDRPLAVTELASWQTAGLSLAVFGLSVYRGIGVLAALPVVALAIWSLARLRSAAPGAGSTAELVGSTLGEAAAGITRLLQLAAYLLLGSLAALTAGLAAATTGLQVGGNTTAEDPTATLSWLWVAWMVAAVAVAGLLTALLSTRAVATVAAVLGGAGLLVYFYVALATVAKILSGSTPAPPYEAPPSGMAGTATVIGLAAGLVGFEVATVATARLGSVGRPLAWAIVAVTIAAVTGLLAVNVGTAGGFSYGATDLGLLVTDLFSPTMGSVVTAATGTIGLAALLVLLWAISRLMKGATLAATVLVAALAAGQVLNWDVSAKLTGVGAMLLLVIYLAIAEANSRLEAAQTMSWAAKIIVAVALTLVVVVPVLAAEDRVAAAWPVVITIGIIAAAVGFAVVRRGLPLRPPR